jgi:hypothetical protein
MRRSKVRLSTVEPRKPTVKASKNSERIFGTVVRVAERMGRPKQLFYTMTLVGYDSASAKMDLPGPFLAISIEPLRWWNAPEYDILHIQGLLIYKFPPSLAVDFQPAR